MPALCAFNALYPAVATPRVMKKKNPAPLIHMPNRRDLKRGAPQLLMLYVESYTQHHKKRKINAALCTCFGYHERRGLLGQTESFEKEYNAIYAASGLKSECFILIELNSFKLIAVFIRVICRLLMACQFFTLRKANSFHCLRLYNRMVLRYCRFSFWMYILDWLVECTLLLFCMVNC